MNKADINYSSKTIVQASHLKLQIKSLAIRKDKHTLFSLDIEAFYPLVMYGLLERAIKFFSSLLGEKKKAKTKECLNCIWNGQYSAHVYQQVL
jgi:hypothetical protein